MLFRLVVAAVLCSGVVAQENDEDSFVEEAEDERVEEVEDADEDADDDEEDKNPASFAQVVSKGFINAMARIQAEGFGEGDYRGDRFKDFHAIDNNGVPVSLRGNNDLLVFTKPDMMYQIHKEYYLGGSDICETNTFNGTAISQEEYKMQDVVYELNKVASELAKKAAADDTWQQPHKPRFVAGAMGPTSRTLSVPQCIEDPTSRNVTWDEMDESYKEQVRGLVDGGCDLLMIETIFDTQNSKAAIFAVDGYFEETGKDYFIFEDPL